MKVAFDTSVIVSALVQDLERHPRAHAWLDAARRGSIEASMSWHALAETWAVLTRLPREPPISPRAAREVVERVSSVVMPRELNASAYAKAIARCAERGLRSGAIFDALHLVSAEEDHAEIFLTFNGVHFQRLSLPEGPKVVEPPDPPSVPRLRESRRRHRKRTK